MATLIRIINVILSFIKYSAHILVYYYSDRELLDYEASRWLETHHIKKRSGIRAVLYLLAGFPEYRSLYYLRTGKSWLNKIAKGQNNLEFYMESSQIGRGLVIWHGFSTVINAISIGENCQIWQNVTIGKSSSKEIDDKPIIGNNVSICANSVVIGEIKISDNCIIGAGAIAVKDLPENSIVVNQTSRIITRN